MFISGHPVDNDKHILQILTLAFYHLLEGLQKHLDSFWHDTSWQKDMSDMFRDLYTCSD